MMEVLELIKQLSLPSPIQNIELEGRSISIKREDLIHPQISGNKWRKLKYNLEKALSHESTVVSFGGAFSNHLHALAAATQKLKLKSIGIVRGHHADFENPTLSSCLANGMELIKISSDEYRLKEKSEIINQIISELPNTLVIPEGGSNDLAVQGCKEIYDEILHQHGMGKPLTICIAAGTGTTAAGILAAANAQDEIIIFNALKNAGLTDMINSLCPTPKAKFEIIDDFHFGGFAKVNTALISFINDFKSKYDIQLEPIYTGKMMFGLCQLIRKNRIAVDRQLVVYHSGGLQGIKGFNQRFEAVPELLINV